MAICVKNVLICTYVTLKCNSYEKHYLINENAFVRLTSPLSCSCNVPKILRIFMLTSPNISNIMHYLQIIMLSMLLPVKYLATSHYLI